MRRPAKGGTSHPPVNRPGQGYGRPLRPRPDLGADRGPDRDADDRPWLDPEWWVTGEVADAEAPAASRSGAVAET